jgi:hypothetical protein
VFAHLRTILIVTIVTVLIWVFAESETLQPADRATQLVFQVDAGSNRVLDIINSEGVPLNESSVRVTMWVEGPGPAIEALDEALRPGSIEIKPGALGLDLSGGARDLRLVDALRASNALNDVGVTILRTDPEFVRVLPDEIVTRRMRVEVPAPGGETDGLPEARPAEVDVTMTKTQSDALGQDAVAVARIDAGVWPKLIPGKRENVPGVRLELPGAIAGRPRVKANPATVDVSLTLKSKTASIKLDSVPVAIRVAPEEFNNWTIQVPQSDRFLTDVTVNGPAEYIAQISNQSIQLIAVVSLTFEELEKRIPSKEAVFSDVPAGVKVDAANRTVRMTITPREPEKKNGVPSGNP